MAVLPAAPEPAAAAAAQPVAAAAHSHTQDSPTVPVVAAAAAADAPASVPHLHYLPAALPKAALAAVVLPAVAEADNTPSHNIPPGPVVPYYIPVQAAAAAAGHPAAPAVLYYTHQAYTPPYTDYYPAAVAAEAPAEAAAVAGPVAEEAKAAAAAYNTDDLYNRADPAAAADDADNAHTEPQRAVEASNTPSEAAQAAVAFLLPGQIQEAEAEAVGQIDNTGSSVRAVGAAAKAVDPRFPFLRPNQVEEEGEHSRSWASCSHRRDTSRDCSSAASGVAVLGLQPQVPEPVHQAVGADQGRDRGQAEGRIGCSTASIEPAVDVVAAAVRTGYIQPESIEALGAERAAVEVRIDGAGVGHGSSAGRRKVGEGVAPSSSSTGVAEARRDAGEAEAGADVVAEEHT